MTPWSPFDAQPSQEWSNTIRRRPSTPADTRVSALPLPGAPRTPSPKPVKTCDTEGCGEKHYSLGWCRGHYRRFVRHGDPLGGSFRYGEPLRFFREVVLAYDGNECLTWPYNKDEHGYGRLCRNGRSRTVSRLVCEEEYGPAPTPAHQAAHSCGRGHEACVTKRHLSWKTPKENNADKIIHGTHNRGARAGSAKLTESEVLQIRALRGVSQRKIAKKFGVNQGQVSAIQRGASWSWLGDGS